MKPIGGFFELEIGGGGTALHAGALGLCSGRACLLKILELARPARAWVPFYICDSALSPFARAGVEVAFYAIGETLDPLLPAGVPAGGDLVMVVNYFGVKTRTAAALVAQHPRRVIVDDTHAFFSKGYEGGWSFNSARKFFGVPDGGYAYGPGVEPHDYPRPPSVRYDHLVNRLLGNQQLAFDQYRESEANVPGELWRMSRLAERLLDRVDYAAARDARRRNFTALHLRFAPRNLLRVDLTAAADETPYCYPLLCDRPVPWDALWRCGVYAPALWPDVGARAGAERYAWESALHQRLLPLPIDHRYGPDDLDRLSSAVNGVMQW